MKLSITSTLHSSAPYICEFRARASAAAETFSGDDYEILLVNDGSLDESLNRAAVLARDEVTRVDLFATSVHRCGEHVSGEGTVRSQAAALHKS
jgi:hypothetical protein